VYIFTLTFHAFVSFLSNSTQVIFIRAHTCENEIFSHACERTKLSVHIKHIHSQRRVSILRLRAFYVCVFLITLPTPSLPEIKRENPLSLGSASRFIFPFASLIPANVDCALGLKEMVCAHGIINVHAFAMRVFMVNSLRERITLVINYFKLSNRTEDNFSKLSMRGVISIINIPRETKLSISVIIEVKDFPDS
jgi:hypothetical protein